MLSRRSAIPDGQTVLEGGSGRRRNKPRLTGVIRRVDTAFFHVREKIVYVVIMGALRASRNRGLDLPGRNLVWHEGVMVMMSRGMC
jgi:hypothetical protein